MGDMADFALDGACDECEDYDRFASGYYSRQEAYERGFTNELGGEERGPKGWHTLCRSEARHTKVNPAIKQLSCKHCGVTGVMWKQHETGKWWLWDIDANAWHSCKKEVL